jgi:hypothetical protein
VILLERQSCHSVHMKEAVWAEVNAISNVSAHLQRQKRGLLFMAAVLKAQQVRLSLGFHKKIFGLFPEVNRNKSGIRNYTEEG